MAPPLSVVVGTRDAGETTRSCLAALSPQAAALGAEVVVVGLAGDDRPAAELRGAFPGFRFVASYSELVPQLWAEGLESATGEAIAFLSADCVPGPHWAAAMLQALGTDHAAVGGAFECDPRAGLAGAAVFFCRYHRFLPPFPDGPEADPATDNAIYRRSALAPYRELWAHGFWEPPIHAAMRRDGLSLRRTARAVVSYARPGGAGAFISNRLRHGRRHGASRAALTGGRLRVLLQAPLVPFVMWGRAARSVARRRALAARFALASPLMLVFFGAWAFGEAAGAARAR
jgi:hypothetical protein